MSELPEDKQDSCATGPESGCCCGKNAPEASAGQAGAGKKKKSAIIIPFAIAVAATVVLFLLLNQYLANRKPDLPAQTPRPVKTLVVAPAHGELLLKYPGYTRAIQQVDVGFQVSGSLVDLPINSGEIVKKGQAIARLDPRDYQNTLDARTADYLNAKTNLERQQKLFASATIPKSKLDDAVAAFKVTEASKQIAEKARQDCILKAPFDGVIAKRYVDNYQTVAQGQPVVSLQDLSNLEVEVDFPEWLVAKARGMAKGSKATAEYDSLPGKIIALKVREFAAEADPQTRTFPVRFNMLHNPDTNHVNILPGMTATVTITVVPKDTDSNLFLLPVWSVVSDNKTDGPYVYVVNDKVQPWVVSQRRVVVGELTDDSILVKSGLQSGDRVVVAGASRLEKGMNVCDLPAFLREHAATESEAESLGTEQSVPASSAQSEGPIEVIPQGVEGGADK